MALTSILPSHPGLIDSELFDVDLDAKDVASPASRDDEVVARPHMLDKGVLAGRLVGVGPGTARQDGIEDAHAARQIFRHVGSVLSGIRLAAGVLAKVVVALPALFVHVTIGQVLRRLHEHVFAPGVDRAFRARHADTIGLLEQPSALSSNPAVMKRIMDHARAQNTPLTEQQLSGFIAAGERLSAALLARGTASAASNASPTSPDPAMPASATASATNAARVDVEFVSATVSLPSCQYTTRALSWFLMAQAARLDILQTAKDPNGGVGNMATSGSFVVKDPGNAVYAFLSGAPSAGDRISTHFNERADHGNRHPLFAAFGIDKALQRGIDDYRHMLPGKGGAILFDKLAGDNGSQELFIKFEDAGSPPLTRFERDEHASSVWNFAHRVTGLFSAAHRHIQHSASFVATRGDPVGAVGAITRQEHVKKGILRPTIADPFLALVRDAVAAGIVPAAARQESKSLLDQGLQAVNGALDAMLGKAVDAGVAGQSIAERTRALRTTIVAESDRLGMVSDDFGIQRRGAEVHLSLSPI